MNDLVQRLNQASNKNKHTPIGVLWNLCDEAADKIEQQEAEIERLQAENQQLREHQEALELRNLPEWKPSITPESLK